MSFIRISWLLALALACAVAWTASSPAASSSTVVGAYVPSATSLDLTSCRPGQASTDFGIVQPGDSVTTSADCSVTFGSSNDTARLDVRQADQLGDPMWAYGTGLLDQDWDGDLGGGDGAFLTSIAASTGEYPADATATTDGATIIGGSCTVGGIRRSCLAKLGATGAKDPTFDGPGAPGDGAFVYQVASASDEYVYSVDTFADGSIVTAGECYVAAVRGACFSKLRPNGSLDPSFDGPAGNGDGRFRWIPPGSASSRLHDALVTSTGQVAFLASCAGHWCVGRLKADGALDPTFGAGTPAGPGMTQVPGTANIDPTWLYAMEEAPDGDLVLAGSCLDVVAAEDGMCVVRVNQDGSVDTTFGDAGYAVELIGPAGTYAGGYAMDIQQDGRIVVSGECEFAPLADPNPACIARFEADGDIDPTFTGPTGSSSGSFVFDFGDDEWVSANGLIVQDDGRILVSATGCAPYTHFCVARFTTTGAFDLTFDGPSGTGDGRVLVPELGTGWINPGGFVEGVDGEAIVVATCSWMTSAEICSLKLDGGGTIESYDDGPRDWDSPAPTTFFGACLSAVSGGAAASTWVPNLGCGKTDGGWWNAIEPTPSVIATTSAPEPAPADARVDLRFGMRIRGSMPAGRYVAPITFNVVAPAVP